MTTTPHRVGQIAKAEILVAHLLETAPADADNQRQAAVIVAQLQTELGWTPPRDLTETPAPRPERSDLDGDGYRQFQAARAELAARRRNPS